MNCREFPFARILLPGSELNSSKDRPDGHENSEDYQDKAEVGFCSHENVPVKVGMETLSRILV